MLKPRRLDPKFALGDLVAYARSCGVDGAEAARLWTVLVRQELKREGLSMEEIQEVEIHLSVLKVAASKPMNAYRNYGRVKRDLLRGWIATLQ